MLARLLTPRFAAAVLAMVVVVTASNILVQFPLRVSLGPIDLADILTWGAFTYPLAFLVSDLTNRHFGANTARIVVVIGFWSFRRVRHPMARRSHRPRLRAPA